ncbi:SMI1/KNR4 family protein [Loktanella sp. 3ANDIMAR09]|uniref:SMI1/KNR4 family protein n=1 Tax=Loktanella sp. 3ANDIMAR09 TaxID=1225657 RepID=UPI00155EF977|nr:SMI1/KNR4 family protein [Loktanella sp. 3ANDIMAR09]
MRRQGVFLRPVGETPDARLTEARIAAQETRLGVRLPEPWRQVYTHFNGGWSDRLYWGDPDDPRLNDPKGIIHAGHEYLRLEDAAPLRDFMVQEMPGHDWQRLDPRLIAIACRDCQAMVLDYREGDDPKVCSVFFSEYVDDPLDGWEQDEFTHWWPNMRVFFRGLYIQDRLV